MVEFRHKVNNFFSSAKLLPCVLSPPIYDCYHYTMHFQYLPSLTHFILNMSLPEPPAIPVRTSSKRVLERDVEDDLGQKRSVEPPVGSKDIHETILDIGG